MKRSLVVIPRMSDYEDESPLLLLNYLYAAISNLEKATLFVIQSRGEKLLAPQFLEPMNAQTILKLNLSWIQDYFNYRRSKYHEYLDYEKTFHKAAYLILTGQKNTIDKIRECDKIRGLNINDNGLEESIKETSCFALCAAATASYQKFDRVLYKERLSDEEIDKLLQLTHK